MVTENDFGGLNTFRVDPCAQDVAGTSPVELDEFYDVVGDGARELVERAGLGVALEN